MATKTVKKTIEKSVEISATREQIWSVLTGLEDFKDWGASFCPGSYFEGDWSEGSKMLFLGPDPNTGETGGMVARIVEHKPGYVCRAEHIGVIGNGVEYYEGDIFDEWIPAKEEYFLEGGPDTFTLRIATEVPEAYFEMFSGFWDKALARIKELAEAK